MSSLLSSPAACECWWTDYYLILCSSILCIWRVFHALSSLGWATCLLSVFPYNLCHIWTSARSHCSPVVCLQSPHIVLEVWRGYFSWASSSVE